jgi:tight adherence protein C
LAADKNKGSTDLVAPLKIKLMQAGLVNNTHTVWLYLGIKVLLSLIFIIIGLAAISLYNNNTSFPVISLVLIIFFCAGLYFPDLLLMRLTRRRQKVIFNSFPDVLDLMRMCVQSGLGLDQSLDRVGKEIWLTCPPLSKEIELTGLELRAGVSRADSLRNLSLRIGLVDVESFVITLIQSDRFGNSVAEALTIYADSLRSKRRISAEEQAAKLSIKLMIPLIFCIFPALLVVLLGPAIVHIHNSLIPILGG